MTSSTIRDLDRNGIRFNWGFWDGRADRLADRRPHNPEAARPLAYVLGYQAGVGQANAELNHGAEAATSSELFQRFAQAEGLDLEADATAGPQVPIIDDLRIVISVAAASRI